MAQTREEKIEIIIEGTEKKDGLRCLTWPKRYKKVLAKFQELRRLEEADEDLLVDCVTCQKRGMKWKGDYANAGHFMRAKYRMTCFDPENVFVQCSHCNGQLNGNYDEYRKFLGDTKADALREKALSNQTFRHTLEELAELLLDFREALAKEKKRRNALPPKSITHAQTI